MRRVAFEEFTLRDQFGAEHAVGGISDGVTVVVYGDRKAAETSRTFGTALHVLFHPSAAGKPPAEARLAPVRPMRGPQITGGPPEANFPPVRVVAAASAAGVPGPIKSVIAYQLRRAAPDTPVLLDWNGDLKQRFGLTAGEPNAVIIAADGTGYAIDVRGAEASGRVECVVEALRVRLRRKHWPRRRPPSPPRLTPSPAR